jgi:hypothetical protein
MKVITFKNIRIVILLSLLALAAIYTQDQHLNTTSWYQPIEVTVFPINGDGTAKTERYIQQLATEYFQDIDAFFIREAKRYNLIVDKPVISTLGHTIYKLPPAPPTDRNAVFKIILWSMQLRYWAYINTPDDKSNKSRIRLYVLYHQGSDHQALQHSLGLQKGLIGIIHAYADQAHNSQNALVMTHEIFHTLGASDKYDYQNNQPIYPLGYAHPDQNPLYPQRFAEIMAGRIPLSKSKSNMPKDLRFCLVGESTAKEINWISAP